MTQAPLLSADEARLLERLTLRGRGFTVSPSPSGTRRARTRGAGIEFHEYRPYQAGDDPRGIDWTVEARLRQLVVRVPQAEGHLRLHVLVDASGSMGIGRIEGSGGRTDGSKLACACRLAALLSYVAVEHRDAPGLAVFRDRVQAWIPPIEGGGQLGRILDALHGLEARGESAIDAALQHYAATAVRPGIVAVISDFFAPGEGLAGLRALVHRGFSPAVLQVVAPEELEPAVDDDIELVDVESDGGAPLVVDRSVVDAYLARLEHHHELLRTFCAAWGCPHVVVQSNATFRELLSGLEGSGLLASAL